MHSAIVYSLGQSSHCTDLKEDFTVILYLKCIWAQTGQHLLYKYLRACKYTYGVHRVQRLNAKRKTAHRDKNMEDSTLQL